MIKMNLSTNKSEKVSYNFIDFPIRANKSLLSEYPGMSAINHWHNDLEFTLMLKGNMSYSINGDSYDIKENECIFVNSQHMHYGYSKDGSDCEFICILLNTNLFSQLSIIKNNYLDTLFNDTTNAYSILRQSVFWQKDCIEKIKEIYQLCTEKTDGFELQVISIVHSLIYLLYKFLKDKNSKSILQKKNLKAMHDMTGFIQENFQKKLTLEEIAYSGHVSRSSCCSIFQDFLNKTPITYLTEYRLEKSLKLLQFTSYSITEIALQCGFTGSSYYTEIFHKKMRCTPSQYRKNLINSD